MFNVLLLTCGFVIILTLYILHNYILYKRWLDEDEKELRAMLDKLDDDYLKKVKRLISY